MLILKPKLSLNTTEKYGKKEYEDADEVLDALVAVEEAYGTEEALRFTKAVS